MLAALVSLMISVAALARALSAESRLDPMASGMVHNMGPRLAKTATDTVLLMGPWGSSALENGQFQTSGGMPAWNGWTSKDLTLPSEGPFWHATDFRTLNGSFAAWCEDLDIPSCGPGDASGGYGNDWNEILEWRGVVDDPGLPCTIDIAALVQVRLEEAMTLPTLRWSARTRSSICGRATGSTIPKS